MLDDQRPPMLTRAAQPEDHLAVTHDMRPDCDPWWIARFSAAPVGGAAGSVTCVIRRLPSGNLPSEIASFVDRRRELTEIRRLLPTTRLLTLTGVGGVGKTRLALRAAGQVRRSFADGVWLAGLAGLGGPGLLPQGGARGGGLAGQTGRGLGGGLAGVLGQRELVLVLGKREDLGAAGAALV